jgi:hypothetical protein
MTSINAWKLSRRLKLTERNRCQVPPPALAAVPTLVAMPPTALLLQPHLASAHVPITVARFLLPRLAVLPTIHIWHPLLYDPPLMSRTRLQLQLQPHTIMQCMAAGAHKLSEMHMHTHLMRWQVFQCRTLLLLITLLMEGITMGWLVTGFTRFITGRCC